MIQITKPLTSYFKRLPDWVIILVLLGLITTQMVLSMKEKSATLDEVMRQLPGYLHLTSGEYWFHPDHPPLIKMVSALPLLFMDIQLSPWPKIRTDSDRWVFAQDFLYGTNNGDRLVFAGRIAVFPLTLLLGFLVFRWTRELFGHNAGFFALLLYSFEPNILANGQLMNMDMAVTCFMFLTIYGFHRLVRQVSLTRLLLTGLSLGLALTTKFSALLSLPILSLLGLCVVFTRHSVEILLPGLPTRENQSRGWKLSLLLAVLLVIGLIGFSMIWGAYWFRYEAGGLQDHPEHGLWDESLPEQTLLKQLLLWAGEVKVLPEAYLVGLARVFRKAGRQAFLMGEVSDGWWYYFVITFVLKTPLALLLLLAWTLALIPRLWRDYSIPVLFLVLPPIVYFVVASASYLNIGHRHLLPIYPFLFVLMGSLIPWAQTQKVAIKTSLAALLLWYLGSSLSIFPHYLAYFNELAGGPNNGHKYLVDSNLDWGQDLKGLKRFMDENGIKRVWLSYFGTASPDYYGIEYNYLPSYAIFKPKKDRLPTSFLAISATNLYGVHFRSIGVDRDFFAEIRKMEPIAKIGYSIFVYRLDNRGLNETR